MWQPNDKTRIEALIGTRQHKAHGRRIKPLSVGQYARVYVAHKYVSLAIKILSRRKRSLRNSLLIRKADSIARRLIKNVGFGRQWRASLRSLPALCANNWERRGISVPNLNSQTYESWLYMIVDRLAGAYGWTLDYILSMPYNVAVDLYASINNREANNFQDSIIAAISANAGSEKVFKLADDRKMVYTVTPPRKVLKQHDLEEHRRFMRHFGAGKN